MPVLPCKHLAIQTLQLNATIEDWVCRAQTVFMTHQAVGLARYEPRELWSIHDVDAYAAAHDAYWATKPAHWSELHDLLAVQRRNAQKEITDGT